MKKLILITLSFCNAVAAIAQVGHTPNVSTLANLLLSTQNSMIIDASQNASAIQPRILNKTQSIAKNRKTIYTYKYTAANIEVLQHFIGNYEAMVNDSILTIIDGLVRPAIVIADIDAATIAHIKIIKDKEEIAAYGAKDKNTIVLITTKQQINQYKLAVEKTTTIDLNNNHQQLLKNAGWRIYNKKGGC